MLGGRRVRLPVGTVKFALPIAKCFQGGLMEQKRENAENRAKECGKGDVHLSGL
jgi:hypothetical protein